MTNILYIQSLENSKPWESSETFSLKRSWGTEINIVSINCSYLPQYIPMVNISLVPVEIIMWQWNIFKFNYLEDINLSSYISRLLILVVGYGMNISLLLSELQPVKKWTVPIFLYWIKLGLPTQIGLPY